ncbi:hypothetical protein RHMOL_Rhmol11G0003300 [Rhododendron molle]|uniref:Uncharacterized protein n=1 Tax=Rhododendron molle TaxID=49168 RepID=A0ACC0LMQ7_RHOML|nr:hypothetical protein RHMOL_Rhmol11G0003300 [Rhododendron molle]
MVIIANNYPPLWKSEIMYYAMLTKQASNYGCMKFDKIGIIHFSEKLWEKRDHPLFGEFKRGCSDTYGKSL